MGIDIFEKTRRSGEGSRYRLSRAGQSYWQDLVKLVKFFLALAAIAIVSAYLATTLVN